MKKTVMVALVLFTFTMGAHREAFSLDRSVSQNRSQNTADHDVVVINRPVNIQGLTGLIFTNSAYTLPQGTGAVGLSGLLEDSDVPNYSAVMGAFTVTYGITDRVEVGVKARLTGTNLGSSTTREIGTGDVDVLIKWRFSEQGEIMPALAFGLAGTVPTGSEDSFKEVKYEGIRIMVIGSAENRVLDDGFVGVYFEGQVVLNDQFHSAEDSSYKEMYGVINAGILFPISDDNRMQFLLEYNRVVNKDIMTMNDANYNAVMPGIRYVTENFNINIGVQLMNREANTLTASQNERFVGAMSYRF